jgi:hypothetical protein
MQFDLSRFGRRRRPCLRIPEKAQLGERTKLPLGRAAANIIKYAPHPDRVNFETTSEI